VAEIEVRLLSGRISLVWVRSGGGCGGAGRLSPGLRSRLKLRSDCSNRLVSFAPLLE